jgi:hypothetical protein
MRRLWYSAFYLVKCTINMTESPCLFKHHFMECMETEGGGAVVPQILDFGIVPRGKCSRCPLDR